MADTDSARIAKVLARAGLASRRDAEVMIAEGRVAVNGRVIDTPALTVGPSDRIEVDGRPLPAPEPARLWRFHKPAGLVTTARDEEGRPTVFDRLPAGMPRVMTVGRLDLTSEGLLLLTNDGDLKRRMELPSTGWLRRYRVRVHGTPDETRLAPLRDGIVIEGEVFQPMEVRLDRQQGANAWLTVGLREGRNREVRRAMEAVGLVVGRLIRVSYGPFQLGDLEAGAVEEVPARVLRDQFGMPEAERASAARGPTRSPGKGPQGATRGPGKPGNAHGAGKTGWGPQGASRGDGARGPGRRATADAGPGGAEPGAGVRRAPGPGAKAHDARRPGPKGDGVGPGRRRSAGAGDSRPQKTHDRTSADGRPARKDGTPARRGPHAGPEGRPDQPGKPTGRPQASGKGAPRARDEGAERPRGPGRPKDKRPASAGGPDRRGDRPAFAGKGGGAGAGKPAAAGEARVRGAADASRPRPDRGKPAAGAKSASAPGKRRDSDSATKGRSDTASPPARRPSGPAPTHFRPPPPALRARMVPDGAPDASDPSQSLGRRRRPTRPRPSKPPRVPRGDRTPPDRS